MQFIKIGNVANTHGIKGELSVYPYTDDIQNYCKYKKMYFGEEKKEFTIIKARPHKNMVLVLLQGISTPEEAKNYKTLDVYIDKEELKKLDDNSYYIEDLIGLEVIDIKTSNVIGILNDVIKNPSNDVYEIATKDQVFYIPAIREVIKKVDILNNKLYVELMEGLR